MEIRDRVVVVTGASSGIGRATARALARRGAKLVLTARRADALADAVQECRDRGASRAFAIPADVTDESAVRTVAETAVRRMGVLDAWVNCAAVTLFGGLEETPAEAHRRVWEVNVMGYLHGARAAVPHLRLRPEAVLVNISSVVGVVAQPYTLSYTASKFAERAMSVSLREELRLAGDGHVRVCSVLPAAIDTPIFSHGANLTGRRVRPLSPVYRPERVARAVTGVIRRPRREVVAGPMGRALLLAHTLAPGPVERQMALMMDKQHLSPTESEKTGMGNLYEPWPGRGSVTDGWRGLLGRVRPGQGSY
ncbi:SDR family NAD(P)-dependent oxidoreductase, partial [Streptomyces alkaliphilus]